MTKQATKRKAANPEVEDLFSTTLRLEARDVPRVELVTPSSETVFVPLRLGNQRAGIVRATVLPETETLSVSITTENGRGTHVAQLGMRSFTKNGTNHRCLRCPGCKQLRKWLFLLVGNPDKSIANWLACQFCIEKRARPKLAPASPQRSTP